MNMLRVCVLLFVQIIAFGQESWTSKKYGYTVEIPKNFHHQKLTLDSEDLNISDGISCAIVISVQDLPVELRGTSINELIGDEESYRDKYVEATKEYMQNLKWLKMGWSTISGYSAFYWEQTEGVKTYFSRIYMFIRNNKIFSVAFGSYYTDVDSYASIWYRFKQNAKF